MVTARMQAEMSSKPTTQSSNRSENCTVSFINVNEASPSEVGGYRFNALAFILQEVKSQELQGDNAFEAIFGFVRCFVSFSQSQFKLHIL
jgi:hypothetical protein